MEGRSYYMGVHYMDNYQWRKGHIYCIICHLTRSKSMKHRKTVSVRCYNRYHPDPEDVSPNN